MKRIAKTYGLMVLISAFLIVLDQYTKSVIRTYLEFGEIWMPWKWLEPYARIIHINNTGAAFGLFKGANSIFMVLAVIVAGAIIYYYPSISKKDWVIRIALSMQLAGAVGNLIDRIQFGRVTDFISIGTFAVWNVADASITVGVVVLLVGIWVQDNREKKAKLLATETTDEEQGAMVD